MALTANQKRIIVEAVVRSASEKRIEDAAHRQQLVELLLRPTLEQKAAVVQVITELKGKYEDTLAGYDAQAALQRQQLVDGIADLAAILTELGA